MFVYSPLSFILQFILCFILYFILSFILIFTLNFYLKSTNLILLKALNNLFSFILKMQSSQSHHNQQNQVPECCFIEMFSKRQVQTCTIQRNSHGLINPHKKITNNQFKQSAVFKKLKLKAQSSGTKRSISSFKVKRRATNRKNTESQGLQIQQQMPVQRNPQKIVTASVDAQALKRFYSPKMRYSSSMVSFPIQKARFDDNLNYFPTNQRQIRFEQNQNVNKFEHNNRISVFLPLLNSSSLSQHPQKTYQTYKKLQVNIQNLERNQNVANIENSQSRLRKKRDFGQIQKFSNDFSKKQSLKNSLKLKKPQLHDIDQASRQESRRQEQVQEPINLFQYIQSYIVEVSKPKQSRGKEQDQFDSIKTKGRAAQSMMFISKDLRKTKKPKRNPLRQSQRRLQQLQNIIVTSEYQEEEEQFERRQVIEQSAVMMNFFNPPNHFKDKLQLSRSKNTGFY